MEKPKNPSIGDHGSSIPHKSHNSEVPSPQPFTTQPSSSVSIPKPTSEKTAIHGTSPMHNSNPSGAKVDDDTDSTVPNIKLPSTELASLRAPWKHCLIAEVLGKRIRLQYYYDRLLSLWSPEGTLEIFELGSDFFLLNFSLPMDCEKVLEGGPWLIHQHYITLRPWTPDFKPSEATTATHVKVWVDLPELPIEYYDREVLLRIGASIGRPVKIHPITERRERVRFARLCVEIDLKRPFLSQIKLGQLQQQIRYKGHVGHLQQDFSPHSTPCPQCQLHAQTSRKSGPYHKSSLGNELARSGTGFVFFEQDTPLDPTAQSKPNKGKSAAIISSSISFPDHTGMNSSSPDHIGKNSRPNKSIERNRHLQAGEGTSSSPMSIKTPSTPAEETLTGCSRTPSEPKVSSILCTSMPGNLPHDSFQQTQQTPFVASSQIPNSDLAVNTSFNSNLHQRPKQAAAPSNFSLYSQAMQHATELQDIKSTPDGKMELSTEDSRMDFSIKRTPTVLNIEPTISNIQIRVSNSPQFSSISIIPTVTNHITAHQNLKTNPATPIKRILIWKCGGAGDRKFMQAIRDLIQLHKPSILVLTDPKTCGADAYGIIKEIGFSADPSGLTYGIWVLWHEEDVDVELTSSAPYQISASVQVFPEVCNNPLTGMPFGAYDNFEPFSQPSGPSIFYTSEEFIHAPTSEWVLLGEEGEAEQILLQSLR